jgi:Catalytic LigB subunit of aromatic ring-opening dioxygenase
MASIVAGFASSHTPLMSLPGQDWPKRAEDDKKNRELVRPIDGAHVTYDELLASADPKIQEQLNEQEFVRKYENIQRNLDELQRCFIEVNPDVVVMIGDDQDEMFFDDNYPMISVYWGDTLTHYPRASTQRPGDSEAGRIASSVYGTETIDYPIQKDLGLHLIESLAEQDFDVAHSRYMKEEYGGTIGPATWYLNYQRVRAPRKQGMAHAFSFPICRWFGAKRPPAVPITINTCYPPNWISPRRAYNLGKAVKQAIEAWDSEARVAIVTSGGLSHFTVDEELDRAAIKGLTEANSEILTSLPRYKLQSASTEVLNWVTAAGAMEGTPMTLMMYEPGYRSPAGTGCGCAVGRWEVE